jgi:type VI secretion system secreted protein VgrG
MSNRLLELEPRGLFGDDAILTTLDGREEISKPFDFLLTIASPKTTIRPEDVIGKPLAVRINRGEEEPRYIHGYVSSFWAGNSVAPESGGTLFRMYRVRIVPWLWFMSQASRCFIYLPEKGEKSIQDVLDQILKRVKSYGHVSPDVESGNAKVLSKRTVEHCVQYRETDLNFFSRTLERYGVRYYYKYANDKHVVVLSDQINYPNAPEAEVRFPITADNHDGDDIITSWEHSYEFVSGKWEHTDYDFINPSTNLKSNALKHSSISLQNNQGYERYDYPGDFVRKDDGKSEAEIRLEAQESQFNTVQGTSLCKTFSPGYCFKLTDHPTCKDEKGKSYLLTSVYHSASQPGPFNEMGGGAHYSNSFTCVSRELQYRPQQHAQQPVLSSIQTAMVVGPKGEEIYTDEYGRVKVQFHWDREGKRDENTSCWIRVSQSHAGRGFGGIDIPRVGEEVVVSFLEGDPDRPLITGRVYHKEAMPPFGLPAEKTRSGLKSKTYKGSGYNEMSMDDTAGEEQIRINAQHNMDTTVGNDQTLKVGNNRTKDIGVDEVMSVGNNQKLKVGVNKTVDVGTDHTETVGANQNVKVGANQAVKVGANQSVTVAANQSNSVGVAKTETVGMMSNEMVGFMKTTNVGAAYSIISAAAMNTAVGFVSAEEVGMTKKIVVGSKLEIIVGASKLVMEAGGKVTIEGTEFLFSASGNVKINGSIIDLN